MLLQAYLCLWAMTVFMIQLATPLVLFILSEAGSSSCKFKTCWFQTNWISDLQNCNTEHCQVHVMFCLLSFLLQSNRTTLQKPVYQVFDHANGPIKTHWSYSKSLLNLIQRKWKRYFSKTISQEWVLRWYVKDNSWEHFIQSEEYQMYFLKGQV